MFNFEHNTTWVDIKNKNIYQIGSKELASHCHSALPQSAERESQFKCQKAFHYILT